MTQREDLRQIWEAALAAVDPADAVARHLCRKDNHLQVKDATWDLGALEHLWVVAVGKAAVPMATAADAVLGGDITRGIVITKYEHATAHKLPPAWTVIEAGHPIPDESGLKGGRAIVELLDDATDRDLVVVLLSGGGSALMPAPVDDVTLEDLQTTTDLLLRAGATIVDINAIRKHVSWLKGGQLARLAAPAPVVALILSDVVGDPMDVIASGPTAADPTTYAEALTVLKQYGILDQTPDPIVAHLNAGMAGEMSETPKPGDDLFERVLNVIVGSNHLAAKAAFAQAERLGYDALLLTTFVEGEAREVAKVAVALAKGVRAHGHPIPAPACLVWGGETTVTVRGQGKGGRNQELALAASLGLEGIEGTTLLALATDGTDGPTDAAGAIVTGSTAAQARERGWNVRSTLEDNNAYPLLEDVDALLHLGPTGTNVNDLLILLVI